MNNIFKLLATAELYNVSVEFIMLLQDTFFQDRLRYVKLLPS